MQTADGGLVQKGSSGAGLVRCKGQTLRGAVGVEEVDLSDRICCCKATLLMHEQPHCGQSEHAQGLDFTFFS